MGRTKSLPSRKDIIISKQQQQPLCINNNDNGRLLQDDDNNNNNNNNTEILGRCTLVALQQEQQFDNDDGIIVQQKQKHYTKIDLLLAAELEQDRQSLDGMYYNNNNNKRQKQQEQEDQHNNSNDHRFIQLITRLEKEHYHEDDNKQQRKRSIRKKRNKKHTKTKKYVTFAEEESLLTITIPKPEIQIIYNNNNNNNIKNDKNSHHNNNNNNKEKEKEELFLLWEYPFPYKIITNVNTEQQQQQVDDNNNMIEIHAKLAVMDVFKLINITEKNNNNSNNNNSDDVGRLLGHAIQTSQLLKMYIITTGSSSSSSSSNEINNNGSSISILQIYISSYAIQLCNQIPIGYNNKKKNNLSKKNNKNNNKRCKNQDIIDINTIIMYLYNINYSKNTTNTTSTTTTAKHIYKLTDNVQIIKHMNDDDNNNNNNNKLINIKGLIPTLRPYQQYAVQWMLQREQKQKHNKNNNEWELAWIVLLLRQQHNNNNNNINKANVIIIPLPEYNNNNNNNKDGSKLLLLFCPFTGWLATSIEHAKILTIGDNDNNNGDDVPHGGILGESMGLGKTVEVLACILANPYKSDTEEIISTQQKHSMSEKMPSIVVSEESSSNNSSTTQRKLDFDDNRKISASSSSSSSLSKQQEQSMVKSAKKVGYVDDLNEFADNDDDSDNDSTTSDDEFLHKEVTATTTTGVTTTTVVPPVTPEKVDDEEPIIEERWMDDDILGACICGDLIGFDHNSNNRKKENNDIILCKSCDEPMHIICAGFESKDEMKQETKPVRLLQRFTNTPLICRLCDAYRCPCCTPKQISGATLIIMPPSILSQWEREIRRHARKEDGQHLHVVTYEGIKRLGNRNSGRGRNGSVHVQYMHPEKLAKADIVLMTFDALMSDLSHSDDNRFVQRHDSNNELDVNLRKRKRYRVVPSPLQSIKWWRICLDEAQRVETPTAGSAQMALKLESKYRWCISGTPVGKGKLEDLYGLLLFLRLKPFCNKQWFRKCFDPSYGDVDIRIKHLLLNIFWRSTKKLDAVREQMGVPEQIEKKIILKFSSIERHFYERQLEQTLNAAGDLTENEKKLKKRKASHLNILAEHLHRLRAACCHPQVGSSGIGSLKRARTNTKMSSKRADTSVISRVMTMSQILDKFIDDAKIQCEEAQRLAVLHTNAMASLSKLKVEAKERGVSSISESDEDLLQKSCELYMQSIRLADDNAEPTLILGETILSGSVGFRCINATIQCCTFQMDWKVATNSTPLNIWSRLDFSLGPGRKITQLRIRPVSNVPNYLQHETSDDFQWNVVYPKECVLQCATAGGEFVDVHMFNIEASDTNENCWVIESGFRSIKSKSWRILVKNFYKSTSLFCGDHELHSPATYIGLEVECFEPVIASDPLQRLHCLHNACLSFLSLQQHMSTDEEKGIVCEAKPNWISSENLNTKINSMAKESQKIESFYLLSARSIHFGYKRRLEEASNIRKKLEADLLNMTRAHKPRHDIVDCWDDMWWDDFLSFCHLYGNETQQRTLLERLFQDLDGALRGESSNRAGMVPFPEFHDVAGLRTALQFRIFNIRSGLGNKTKRIQTPTPSPGKFNGHEKHYQSGPVGPREGRFKCIPGGQGHCMGMILGLSASPSEQEILENSRCGICKEDWNQKGPKCRHCKIEEVLEDLAPDTVTILVLNSLHTLLRGSFGSTLLKSAEASLDVVKRAKKFFDLIDAIKRENVAAWKMWRTHLDLLNDLDELNQSKTAMRLLSHGEDITDMTDEELNAVVLPIDICTRYHDHAAKQAMALGTLSRSKGTLNYLRNQKEKENKSVVADSDQIGSGEAISSKDTCVVCLDNFDDSTQNRSVLRCGHFFHEKCLERLQSRSGGPLRTIFCPMKCRVRTDPKDVMFASNKLRNDGSMSRREVKGSYGTKVSRLVSDVLDLCDKGEKGLVFSQWDDMIDICESAFAENDIKYVRVKSLRQVGSCTSRFRDPDCTVMLLNVKNGAEGLTLLEATHVFMIEPLLNCGLDSQAINRIHRIGQCRRTFVYRYLIEETVEMKIDQLRQQHQEDQLEDLISEGRKSMFKAGGIDGGFDSQEELLGMLRS